MSRICGNTRDDPLPEKRLLVTTFDDFSREETILKPKNAKEYPEDVPTFKDLSQPELKEDTPRGNELWKKIKNEHQDKVKNLYKRLNDKRINDIDSEETQYITNNIFPVMVSGVSECLKKADSHNIIKNKDKFGFDAIDFMAEYMYKHNPLYKERMKENNTIFEVFKNILEKNPRPWIPKSWNWSKDEAAIIIQRNVRGWLVRKTQVIQDMRKFWKILEKPYGAGYYKKEMEQITGITEKHAEIYPELTYPPNKREGLSYDTFVKKRIEEIHQLQKEKANKERFEQEFKKATLQTEKKV